MPDLQFIHGCSHEIDQAYASTDTFNLVRGFGPSDVILSGAVVTKINSVSTSLQTPPVLGIDYDRYLHNQIIWLSANAPAVGSPYTVTATYVLQTSTRLAQEDCPRCQGRGWYMDLINQDAGTAEWAAGTDLATQNFIRFFLMVKGSYSSQPTAGTNAQALISQAPSSLAQQQNAIIAAIKDAEQQTKVYLATYPQRLPPEQQLQQVEILSASYDAQESAWSVSVRLRMATGQAVQVGLAL